MWRGPWLGEWLGDWEGAESGGPGYADMSAVLAGGGSLVGTLAPIATAVESVTPGWVWNPPKRKRIRFEEEQPKPIDKPVQVEPVIEVRRFDGAVKLDPSAQAYIDGIFAELIRQQNAQEQARQAIKVAAEEAARLQAELQLMIAIEAERQARQELMDFDLAFVMAVLAES